MEEGTTGHSNPPLGVIVGTPDPRWIPGGTKEPEQLSPHQGLNSQFAAQFGVLIVSANHS